MQYESTFNVIKQSLQPQDLRALYLNMQRDMCLGAS